jgi:formylglycine-generating enzyme required for sulfatase activity
VLVIDQFEAALANDEAAADRILHALLGRGRADDERDQAVVIAVREDFLGRLVDRLQPHAPNLPILRLPPLTPAGARDALVRPLAARRLGIDDDLLAQLVADLTAAAATLGAEMGWGATPAVYPPHLQLAGARLHETLPDDTSTLTLRQYQQLGGIDEIVRGHLTHVLESELARDQVPIARELFKHLITPAQTRAAPTEAELIATVADPARTEATTAVLEALRHHGLVVRLARGHREASWELIHDSLIPRIQAWMDDHDLERRRALEMLRHHARQSRPEAPSLLAARELRTLRAIPDAVEVVEREWRERAALASSADPPLWTPARLVAHARAVHRRRRLIAGAAIASVAAGLAAAGGSWWIGRRAQQRQEAQIAANLGRFQLELAPFDWDAERLAARGVPIAELPRLRWELREPDPADLDTPGERTLAEVTLRSSELGADGLSRIETLEAPGRAAFLVIDERGRGGARCPPSILPIRMLPGYALRDQLRRLHVAVPTCQATAAGTVEIPAGPFQSGGPGEPPSSYAVKYVPPVTTKDLPRYAIDRTEVTNAAFEIFDGMSALTGMASHSYPATTDLRAAGKPDYPASGMPWLDARAYCRYLGKTLPTSEQWEKALRGGPALAGGARKPYPSRNFPWGAPRAGALAKLKDVPPAGPAPVGTAPADESPYGVRDLAGNVSEWTLSVPVDGNTALRIIRGGSWEHTDHASLVDYMPIENPRPLNAIWYSNGFRCATSLPAPPVPAPR